jgi:hypothetical protein
VSIRHRLFLIAALLVGCGSLRAGVPLDSISCDGCTENQKKALAMSRVDAPGEALVFIVDAAQGGVLKFRVINESEPGHSLVGAWLEPQTAEEREAVAKVMAMFAGLGDDFDTIDPPSEACTPNGSSFASNYVSNNVCRTWANELVRNSAPRWPSSGTSLLDRLIACGFTRTDQGNRKMRVTLRAPDGSFVEIEYTLLIDALGTIRATDTVAIRAVANNIELPFSRQQLLDLGRVSPLIGSAAEDFHRMALNWGLSLHRRCDTTSWVECGPNPNVECTIVVTCKQ